MLFTANANEEQTNKHLNTEGDGEGLPRLELFYANACSHGMRRAGILRQKEAES